ncbi:MAG: DUF362 domain-containing protein [Desulfatibacillaceae bacterium]
MIPRLPEDPQTRREFLRRLFRTTVGSAAALSLGAWLYDPSLPPIAGADHELVRLPDFSLGGAARMSVVRGGDRAGAARAAVKALGGMEAFVQPGERVVLKVNAAFASPPMVGATTHPDMVAAVARMCAEAGAAEVIVTDNPINDPGSCFALTGIEEAAKNAGARVVPPRADLFAPTSLDKGNLIVDWPLLHGPLAGADRLIGLAPVKNHHRSGASMSMKNWYGLLGGVRNVFHQDIHGIIAELALLVRPTLVILDGTMSMMDNGPTGGSLADLKPTNTVVASTDHVAADAFACRLLDMSPGDLPHIAMAEQMGAGAADIPDVREVRLT